jgi:hypothetical protein
VKDGLAQPRGRRMFAYSEGRRGRRQRNGRVVNDTETGPELYDQTIQWASCEVGQARSLAVKLPPFADGRCGVFTTSTTP